MTFARDTFDKDLNVVEAELSKEEVDELLEKLGGMNWWEQEESSQFTGIETFYGFSDESKELFLKTGDFASNYYFQLDFDGSNVAFLKTCGGPTMKVKFDGEDDFNEFNEKVLWNRTFHFSEGGEADATKPDPPVAAEAPTKKVEHANIVGELRRIADELKRQNDILEVDAMLKAAHELNVLCNSTPEQMRRRYETGDTRYETRDSLLNAACARITALSSIAIEPMKEEN